MTDQEKINELQKECDYLHKQNASRRFQFDCYGKSGRLFTKSIFALNKADAKILFTAKFPGLLFDEPYNL